VRQALEVRPAYEMRPWNTRSVFARFPHEPGALGAPLFLGCLDAHTSVPLPEFFFHPWHPAGCLRDVVPAPARVQAQLPADQRGFSIAALDPVSSNREGAHSHHRVPGRRIFLSLLGRYQLIFLLILWAGADLTSVCPAAI